MTSVQLTLTLLLLLVNAVDVSYAQSGRNAVNAGYAQDGRINCNWNAPFINSCSLRMMCEQFNAMRMANCRNCDKYFHCKGNYNAVYRCSGPNTRRTAELISNLREWLDWRNWNNWSDSNADQAANRYGRNGNNCESAYLSAVKCAYNPLPFVHDLTLVHIKQHLPIL